VEILVVKEGAVNGGVEAGVDDLFVVFVHSIISAHGCIIAACGRYP
jgi:hypothetical protein